MSARDPATGALRWSAEGSGLVTVIGSTAVLVRVTNAGREPTSQLVVEGREPASGRVRWSVELDDAMGGFFFVAGGDAFARFAPADDGPGRVTAWDPATGEERWSTEVVVRPNAVAGGVLMGPAIDEESTDPDLLAQDAETGEVLWRTRDSLELVHEPTGRDSRTWSGRALGQLYRDDGTSTLAGIDLATGALTTVDGFAGWPLLALSGDLAVVDANPIVGAFDLAAGRMLWTASVTAPDASWGFVTSAAVTDDLVIVGASNNTGQ